MIKNYTIVATKNITTVTQLKAGCGRKLFGIYVCGDLTRYISITLKAEEKIIEPINAYIIDGCQHFEFVKPVELQYDLILESVNADTENDITFQIQLDWSLNY